MKKLTKSEISKSVWQDPIKRRHIMEGRLRVIAERKAQMMAEKKGMIIKCPKCESMEVVKIFYGQPTLIARKNASEGKLYLSSHEVRSKDDPDWFCKECKKKF